MLMDNHGSHITPKFIQLANKNHIRPYLFIPHLTHCMQPLNVGIFQLYKHWHNEAIQDLFMEFSIEYTLAHFLKDLLKIRDNTFKKNTIRHAFKKSGICPCNATKCIEQLKTFAPTMEETDDLGTKPSLLILSQIQLSMLMHVNIGLQQQKEKIQNLDDSVWNDPHCLDKFNAFVQGTQKIFTQAKFDNYQLSIHQKQKQNDLLQKSTSRKQLKPTGSGLELTKEDA